MNNKIFYVIALILGMILGAVIIHQAQATQTPSFTLCHHTPGNSVTHTFQNIQSYLGHLGTPHSGSTFDTAGACPSPTASPTATPVVTPVPTVSPSPSVTPQPTVVPTETPRVTPTPQPQVLGVSTTETPNTCTGTPITGVTQMAGFERLSPTEVRLWWSKIDAEFYKVSYGLSQSNLPWNVTVQGAETTLRNLPDNQHIWVGIQGTDNCVLGTMGAILDP
jgi:hypothetical protein